VAKNSSAPRSFTPVDPSAGSLIDHHEYFAGAFPAAVRPAKWAMVDVITRLKEMAQGTEFDGDSRYLSLKSTDSDNNFTIPTMWVTIHLLKPGEVIHMHRHTPGSVYYIISGQGHSTVGTHRVDWLGGDTFSCPSYSYHEHFNTGTEDVLIWTVQDLPTYSYNRMMTFQSAESEDQHFLHKAAIPK
jgi:gentisate 1,2-dioxygenase